MGSIADKLNYLNETKQTIKQAIIDKGVSVSDADTFRSYADKIGSIEAGTAENALVPAILEGEWQEYYYTRYTIATGETADFSDTLTQPEMLVFEGDIYYTYSRGNFGTNTDTYATRRVNYTSYTIEGTKVKYSMGLGDYRYYDYVVEDGVAILQQITETETSITTRKFKRILPQMKNMLGENTITKNGTYIPSNYNSYGFSRVKVEVPSQEPNLIEKQITENGTYMASDDGADGYSAVSVNVESKVTEPSGVALNIAGAWTTNADGSANTETGVYYNFTHDGKVQVVASGNVTDLGTYIIDGNVINITGDAGNQTWYYNQDGGIAVEENAESMMWRLVPQGTLEVKENGDYDVTPNTKVNVNVPNQLTAATDAEMENLLVASNLGKVVKFTGTSETYETDTYYVISEV